MKFVLPYSHPLLDIFIINLSPLAPEGENVLKRKSLEMYCQSGMMQHFTHTIRLSLTLVMTYYNNNLGKESCQTM